MSHHCRISASADETGITSPLRSERGVPFTALELENLETAFVPSETACLASFPVKWRRTALCIALASMVLRPLILQSLMLSAIIPVPTIINMSRIVAFAFTDSSKAGCTRFNTLWIDGKKLSPMVRRLGSGLAA
jgi:hypothetical protein